jgi:rare lipoprotein A
MAGKPDGRVWAGWSRGGLALLATLALAGCEGGPGLGTGGDATAAPGDAPALGPTDATAPDVFHATEPGLWDGRPSLGGVWVAHPDVTDPERVRIVNTSNGQEIVGALFRRERDLPGPALQVSSDAAEALGMLAGAPATLDVTALRRQEPPPAPEPAPEAAPAAAEAPATEAPTADAPVAEAPTAQPASSGGGRGLFGGLFGRTPSTAPAPSSGAIATTPLDAAAPAEASAAAPLRFPYVQLATLSTEAGATQAAQALAAKGLPARVAAVPGQQAWRLLLGPATTEAEQTALRDRAVAEGYDDAYLVRS